MTAHLTKLESALAELELLKSQASACLDTIVSTDTPSRNGTPTALRRPASRSDAASSEPVDNQANNQLQLLKLANMRMEEKIRSLEEIITTQKHEYPDWLCEWLRRRAVELDTKCALLSDRCQFLEDALVKKTHSRQMLSESQQLQQEGMSRREEELRLQLETLQRAYESERRIRNRERELFNAEMIHLENLYYDAIGNVPKQIEIQPNNARSLNQPASSGKGLSQVQSNRLHVSSGRTGDKLSSESSTARERRPATSGLAGSRLRATSSARSRR